jgi:TRAP-type mannitol/chloroaromatic compound transport system permease small subunit
MRVDVLYALYPNKVRLWLDFLGGIIFFLPMAVIIGYYSWEFFITSIIQNETSSNPGGLIHWPVRGVITLSFFLLNHPRYFRIHQTLRSHHRHDSNRS